MIEKQNKYNAHESGFTLVELLVVIAIIGILSSVSIAGLSSARTNARDKSIITSMQGILIEATTYRAKHQGSYENFCDIDSTSPTYNSEFAELSNEVSEKNGNADAPTCEDSAAAFSVVVNLNAGTYYCVDNTKYFDYSKDTPDGNNRCQRP